MNEDPITSGGGSWQAREGSPKRRWHQCAYCLKNVHEDDLIEAPENICISCADSYADAVAVEEDLRKQREQEKEERKQNGD